MMKVSTPVGEQLRPDGKILNWISDGRGAPANEQTRKLREEGRETDCDSDQEKERKMD